MSLLSDADISYDKTGDDLDTSALRSGRKYKRPSAPPIEDEEDLTPPEKKNRRSRSGERKQVNIVCTLAWLLMLFSVKAQIRVITGYWNWRWSSSLNISMSFDGLVQNYGNSIANALELLQSCTKPLIYVSVD